MGIESLHHITRPAIDGLEHPKPIFLIHGYGSDENDLFPFAEALPQEYFVISVRAPYAMQPYGNAWYAINFDAEKGKWSDLEQAKASRDLLHEFITAACEHYQLDKDQISLLGFSQGSILSFALGLHYAGAYKNLICLSGYLNEDLYEVATSSQAYNNLKVFASHGSQDMVVPYDWAKKTPDLLSVLKIENTFKTYPMGHGVSPQNFSDLLSWLKESSMR
ncbi:phospholipase [Flavobacteriaceae bacterium LSUCC0859]|jgi:phospholipase/carboxylesterase|nr:phospholipase [Flavobacteriaceae bacterium LSUCC0859]